MLVLGINEMVSCLSSEVLKGYSLFLIYKTNIFVKLLKLSSMPIWLYIYFLVFIFVVFGLSLLVVNIYWLLCSLVSENLSTFRGVKLLEPEFDHCHPVHRLIMGLCLNNFMACWETIVYLCWLYKPPSAALICTEFVAGGSHVWAAVCPNG